MSRAKVLSRDFVHSEHGIRGLIGYQELGFDVKSTSHFDRYAEFYQNVDSGGIRSQQYSLRGLKLYALYGGQLISDPVSIRPSVVIIIIRRLNAGRSPISHLLLTR